MSSSFINILAKQKDFSYSNVELRQHDTSGNYIDGIHKELYNILSAEVINQLKNNVAGSGQINISEQQLEIILKEGNIGLQVKEEIAEKVLERSKLYCPVDTGNLQATGRIERNNNNIIVVYGGINNVDYAWFVHEFTWRNINRDKNPFARAKWLEIAYYEVMREEGFG